MAEGTQQLFLMEFLVEQVNIPNVQAIGEQLLPTTTCVSFQILNLPSIIIAQDPPMSDCACTKNNTSELFKKGKSCLFALPTSVLEKPLDTFPVTMTIFKKLPAGVLPDIMFLGTRQIETKDLVNSLLKEQTFENNSPSRKLKDTFKIKTPTGQFVGSATVFLRISCFGRKIITQFDLPVNNNFYVFKGMKDCPLIQCQRIKSQLELKPSLTQRKKCVCKNDEMNFGTFEKFQTINQQLKAPLHNKVSPNSRRCCCSSVPVNL